MSIPEAARLLGLSGSATMIEIRQRYHTLLKEWHPDVSAHNQEESHEMVIQLNEAYALLVDFCMHYPIPFREENYANRDISYSMQYWREHFGDDPIWG